jgi:hypothetical protein
MTLGQHLRQVEREREQASHWQRSGFLCLNRVDYQLIRAEDQNCILLPLLLAREPQNALSETITQYIQHSENSWFYATPPLTKAFTILAPNGLAAVIGHVSLQ